LFGWGVKICKRYRLVITGTPGVGKHSAALLVAKKLRGSEIIDINKIAFGYGAFLKNVKGETTDEVNIKKLTRFIEDESESKDRCIIIGHLAPYVVNPREVSLVAVLRRSPYHLSSTLAERGYTTKKINDNVVCEILDICLSDTLKVFGVAKTTEIDTSEKSLQKVADIIISTLRKNRKRNIGITDWISLIRKKGDMAKFLQL
jgi:adenylate kinase